MSQPAQHPSESTEAVRKLVVPDESPVAPKEGDRSPTKTERDLPTEVLAAADAATSGKVTSDEVETVRELVVPEEPSEGQEGDRSPTKTERDLDIEAITKTQQPQTQASEMGRKLVVPEA
jgi:hypothetical protein